MKRLLTIGLLTAALAAIAGVTVARGDDKIDLKIGATTVTGLIPDGGTLTVTAGDVGSLTITPQVSKPQVAAQPAPQRVYAPAYYRGVSVATYPIQYQPFVNVQAFSRHGCCNSGVQVFNTQRLGGGVIIQTERGGRRRLRFLPQNLGGGVVGRQAFFGGEVYRVRRR